MKALFLHAPAFIQLAPGTDEPQDGDPTRPVEPPSDDDQTPKPKEGGLNESNDVDDEETETQPEE